MDSISLTFGAQKESRYMYVLVKSDVKGTAEALTRSLQELKLENEEAVVKNNFDACAHVHRRL